MRMCVKCSGPRPDTSEAPDSANVTSNERTGWRSIRLLQKPHIFFVTKQGKPVMTSGESI